jgi:chloramphenicol-sensitive protein RarD
LQGLAVAVAALGVGFLIFNLGEVPWLALVLASSFALYGLVRKVTPVDGILGVSVETLLLMPVAAGFLLLGAWQGTSTFTQDAALAGLLIASGVVTAVPLVCFGQAARRLPLATLGFLQYLSPTLQLLLAVCVFREPFTTAHWVSFPCIWGGLLLFSLESTRAARGARTRAPSADSTLPRLGRPAEFAQPAE